MGGVRLRCQCGLHIVVTYGDAGASLPCECGRTIEVPSLDKLRKRAWVIGLPPDGEEQSDPLPPENKAEVDQSRNPTGATLLLGCCSVVVVLLGLGLLVGNVTGMFPTVPFAGAVVIMLGGAIGAAAERRRRREIGDGG